MKTALKFKNDLIYILWDLSNQLSKKSTVEFSLRIIKTYERYRELDISNSRLQKFAANVYDNFIDKLKK